MFGSARYRGWARNRRDDTSIEGLAESIESIDSLASLVSLDMLAVRNKDFIDIFKEEYDSKFDPNQ